jgi:hypothetical protein
MRLTRDLLFPVYLPTILLAFGQGVMVPVLPLFLREHGASYTVTGIAIAAGWVGTLSADLPVGTILPRLGHRRAFLLGCLVYGLATAGVALSGDAIGLLVICRFASGAGVALWGLSRHAYLATVVPVLERGRAIAVFGGINRIGWFLGPAIGGWIGNVFGLAWAIAATAVLALLAFLVAGLAFEPSGGSQTGRPSRSADRARRGAADSLAGADQRWLGTAARADVASDPPGRHPAVRCRCARTQRSDDRSDRQSLRNGRYGTLLACWLDHGSLGTQGGRHPFVSLARPRNGTRSPRRIPDGAAPRRPPVGIRQRSGIRNHDDAGGRPRSTRTNRRISGPLASRR